MSIPVLTFILLIAAAAAIGFYIRHNSNRFVGRLASAHRDTWIKLGQPRYESMLITTTELIILPYLYRQRFRKFEDAYLNELGRRLRRLYVAFIGVVFAAVVFVAAL